MDEGSGIVSGNLNHYSCYEFTPPKTCCLAHLLTLQTPPCHGQISDLARPAITLTRFEALRRQMCSQLQRRMLARTAVENGVGNEPSPSTRIVNSEQ